MGNKDAPREDDRSLTIVASTGGGKSAHVNSITALHEGLLFCVDPKGVHAKILASRSGKGRAVFTLDPDNASPRWDLFAEIHAAVERAKAAGRDPEDTFIRYAQKAADGLAVRFGQEDAT